MNAALAIFVKTPGHSPVKTRLAARHGREFAECWHRLAAAACASVALELAGRHGVQPYWAVAEQDALGDPDWQSLPGVAQGEGGLGERMARVHRALFVQHRQVLLLGADSPQLSAGLIEPALRWLAGNPARTAIGFAEDGGFWTFGSNRMIDDHAWVAVRYSERDTGRDFSCAMAAFGECLRLPTLVDVDTADELPTVLRALQALPCPTAEQQRLAEWLGQAIPSVA